MEVSSAGGQEMGAINIAMHKKARHIVADQMAQLIGSLPKAPNGGGVGGRVDVSA